MPKKSNKLYLKHRPYGKTQDTFAEKIKVDRGTIGRIERGENVGINTVIDYLKECGKKLVVVDE